MKTESGHQSKVLGMGELLKQALELIDESITEGFEAKGLGWDILKELDGDKLLELLSITKKIRKIILLEAMSRVLSGLTPDQLEAFEVSVEGHREAANVDDIGVESDAPEDAERSKR